MRERFITVMAGVGSALAYFVGGVDTLFSILCLLLIIDFLSGVIVAGVFHNSVKTESGKLNSAISFKGLCKKCYVLVLVGTSHLLDVALGTNFIRGGVILAFISNETISIIENATLMGIPIPNALKKALDVLKQTEDEMCE